MHKRFKYVTFKMLCLLLVMTMGSFAYAQEEAPAQLDLVKLTDHISVILE